MRLLTPRLTTPRLVLEPLDPERDAADLHPAFSDPETMAYWHTPPMTKIEDTRALLAGGRESWEWAIRTEPDGPAVGNVGIENAGPVPGAHTLLRPDARGLGIGTEALTRVLRYGFEDLGMEYIETWVDEANTGSIVAAERVGMVQRGRLALHWSHRSGAHEIVVLGSARTEPDTTFLSVSPMLEVADVAVTAGLFAETFGFDSLFVPGDPPPRGRVRVGPWSTSPVIDLSATGGEVTPSRVYINIGLGVEQVYERAESGSLAVVSPLETKPWFRREFVVALPEGHHLVFSGTP